jgi:hypothetical protein
MESPDLDYFDDGEDEDFSVEDALRVLSLNSHRNTTRWAVVSKQLFVNGRATEDQNYVEPQYERPDPEFEEHHRMLIFEAIAVAKAYIMAGIEAEIQQTRESSGL